MSVSIRIGMLPILTQRPRLKGSSTSNQVANRKRSRCRNKRVGKRLIWVILRDGEMQQEM